MVYAALGLTGVLLASLERVPAFRFRCAPLLRACFTSDVVYLLTGFVAGTSLATAYIVSASALLNDWGVPRLASVDIPLWLGAVLALVALDAGNYVAHWLLHRFDVLWEIHKVHHSSPTLDWLATFRSHLLEQTLRRLIAPLAVIAIGLPLGPTLIGAAIFNAWAMMIHSNLALDLHWLETVLVTPRLHRIHHDPATSHRNFGTFFVLWDRVLRGRFVELDVHADVRFGVPGEVDGYPQGWWSQLAAPFERRSAGGLASPIA